MFHTKFQRVDSTGVDFPIPSCVQQCDKESTDINTIIKRYGRDRVCAACAANPKQPISEELAMLSAEDFTSMMNKTAQIQSQFEELPADVRKRFGHNPANMLEFIQDPANKEEAINYGLIARPDISSTDVQFPATVPPVNSIPVVDNKVDNQAVQGDMQTSQK